MKCRKPTQSLERFRENGLVKLVAFQVRCILMRRIHYQQFLDALIPKIRRINTPPPWLCHLVSGDTYYQQQNYIWSFGCGRDKINFILIFIYSCILFSIFTKKKNRALKCYPKKYYASVFQYYEETSCASKSLHSVTNIYI